MKKFSSKDIKHLYDDTYFLGGNSKITGQIIGVEGYQDFASGKIYKKKIDCANLLNFKNKHVLDIGFGRGEILKYCYKNGAKYCTGIDYSESAYKIAKNYLGDKANLFCLPFDEINKIIIYHQFNVIYMCDTIEHITMDELEIGFKQLVPLLSFDCEMLIMTPSVPSGDYLQMHCNYMTKEKFYVLLDKYFSEINIIDKEKWFYVTCKGLIDAN